MKTKKLFLSAAAIATAATFGTMAVNATENSDTGETTVTYTNNTTINGDSGLWGVTVPTAYSFSDANLTSTGKVELVGINGYTLDELNDGLTVHIAAKTSNNYKVIDTKSKEEIAYTVNYGATTLTANGVGSDDKAYMSATDLTKVAPSVITTATLSKKGTIKGTYTDKVTYYITHTGDELK